MRQQSRMLSTIVGTSKRFTSHSQEDHCLSNVCEEVALMNNKSTEALVRRIDLKYNFNVPQSTVHSLQNTKCHIYWTIKLNYKGRYYKKVNIGNLSKWLQIKKNNSGWLAL
jgi:hypothetical protein